MKIEKVKIDYFDVDFEIVTHNNKKYLLRYNNNTYWNPDRGIKKDNWFLMIWDPVTEEWLDIDKKDLPKAIQTYINKFEIVERL